MRILVVEDNEKMRSLLERGLAEAGHVVETAADGDLGLALAAREEYDAIVLDVMLPGRDGFEICSILRGREVWTPVLMLTARDAVSDRVQGLDKGADDYLVKPFAFEELLGRLRALARRGKTERPNVLRCGASRDVRRGVCRALREGVRPSGLPDESPGSGPLESSDHRTRLGL
jgi:two-component system, OmpR family, response regulator